MSREDEYYDEDEEDIAPRSRLLGFASMLVGLAALFGFVWLAWHAYTSGSATSDPTQAELVKADAAPYKEIPADPGGWQAPHRDKTIYDVIEGNNAQKTGNVAERLTAAPEEPMEVAGGKEAVKEAPKEVAKDAPKDMQGSGSRAWINAKLREDGSEVPLTDAERQKNERGEGKPAEAAGTGAGLVPPAAGKVKAPEALLPKAEPEQLQPVTSPVIPKSAKPAAPAESKTPPAMRAGMGGKARVQLGAFRSEGEAAAHVKHLGSRVPGVIAGHGTNVERADLGEKGIYYRLFATGFSKPDAIAACERIKAARLDCMVK